MKLKERLRIAWQVLAKGTCKELVDAELAKEEAKHMTYEFEHTLNMIQPDCPAILSTGSMVQRISLPEMETNVCFRREDDGLDKPLDRPALLLYSLQYIEEKHVIDKTRENAKALEYIKNSAAIALSKELIRQGLLKMEVLPSSVDYYTKVLRFSVPFYRL